MPGFRLSLEEREEISRGLVAEASFRVIAAELGRPASTVSREVNRNGGRRRYRACGADRAAHCRAARPKPRKLETNRALRNAVYRRLRKRWSPRQIAARLRRDHPDNPGMWVSHETIYQALYVQGRGELRKELAAYLRTGHAYRHHQGRPVKDGRGRLPGMVPISQRPAEADDRAVPGHWEGDLILGARSASAIGTLVERTSRYVMLVHLPHGRDPASVRDALTRKIQRLPEQLRRSLTWDQGKEMAQHAQFTIDSGLQVFFCDPRSPWQRGTGENTNGLLRQYFPKRTDLSAYSEKELDAVALELNDRPRQTLEWMTPSERFTEIVASIA